MADFLKYVKYDQKNKIIETHFQYEFKKDSVIFDGESEFIPGYNHRLRRLINLTISEKDENNDRRS